MEFNRLDEIKGCEHAKRAIEVALSGKHSLILIGPNRSAAGDLCDIVHGFSGSSAGYSPGCDCGNFLDPLRSCICTVEQLNKYHNELLQEEYDIFCIVEPLSEKQVFSSLVNNEDDEKLWKRVEQVRDLQDKRQGKYNSSLDVRNCETLLQGLGERSIELLKQAVKQGLTIEQIYRIVMVALTVKDMAGADEIKADEIKPEHISEAAQYQILRF